MATCSAGHPSESDDYCEVCGIRMSGPPMGAAGAAAGSGPAVAKTAVRTPSSPSSGDTHCPECGEGRVARFCEACGYDFELGPIRPQAQPAQPGTWSVVVRADRDYFDRMMARDGSPTSIRFPSYTPERVFGLSGPHVRIGRSSVSAGFVPEIDLGRQPEDAAVSHEHAVLLPKPDGTWVLIDTGSTNGTTVNDSEEPIDPNVEIAVRDGDRICVGAWTVLTVRKG